MWLLSISCAFIAGVALATGCGIPWIHSTLPLLIALVAAIAHRRPGLPICLALCALAIVVGGARYVSFMPTYGPEHISFYNDEGPLTMEGIIAEQPERHGLYTRFIVAEVRLLTGEKKNLVAGRVLASTYGTEDFNLGDRVQLSGLLESPPTLDEFDYAAYLATNDIYSLVYYPEVKPVSKSGGYPVRACLASVNERLSVSLAKSLPEPEASLAQSLLLGKRSALSSSVKEAFNKTGTTHLLAISGLHLGILLVALLTILLAILGRRHYLYVWLAMATLWAYAAFTGMNPPVTRAAAMASLFLLAELAGRQKNAPTALAFAAAIMVAIKPTLLWDTSFQLSALAMAGITSLYAPLRLSLARIIPSPHHTGWHIGILNSAADVIAATCAATLAIWPVAANTFGAVSLVGIPASLLTIPILPLAISASAATALVNLASPLVAQPLAWICWLSLQSLVGIVTVLSNIPWASVSLHLPTAVVLCYYGFLTGSLLIWKHHARSAPEEPQAEPRNRTQSRSRLRWAIPPLLIAATLVWSAVAVAPDGKLHVVFLDVGQGDAILVISPSGHTVLVDGGGHASETSSMIGNHLPFWNRTLDVVVSTQPHADHIGGLLDIVNRYEVGAVIQSTTDYDSILVEEWRRRLAQHEIPPIKAESGMSLNLDDGTLLTILNPTAHPSTGTSEDVDNNGVVLRIDYGDISFLLTADIRLETERRLVHEGAPLECTVLKVAHHGSKTSSGSQFLTAATPQIAVVSVGADNSYGHPHQTVINRLLEQGIPLHTTAEAGSIEFTTDGTSLWMQTQKER